LEGAQSNYPVKALAKVSRCCQVLVVVVVVWVAGATGANALVLATDDPPPVRCTFSVPLALKPHLPRTAAVHVAPSMLY
jgi:hypothetical protein